MDEPKGLEAQLRAFTQEDSPSHHRWTDSYLAAFAIEAGAQMVTFDKGFRLFPGLNWLLLEA